MGCASAKHVSTVQNEEETQKGKSYQNGDVFGDEYRIKPVEEVKYMKNGGEDDQKIAARNQENLGQASTLPRCCVSQTPGPGAALWEQVPQVPHSPAWSCSTSGLSSLHLKKQTTKQKLLLQKRSSRIKSEILNECCPITISTK
ncbi:uncharacterized protein C1orf21 homolog isoform X1 [Vidua chalybeata]|uniref:uncharacterized protein C1orf21 homolog isoform X1 n=1 Tax=Vidua chalybeata TaxID=81927 RepID=UPI0023A848D1|nr:uncharacterized protein C1orf21 homolog isoform X1 [Vidua chalybeata]